MGSGREVVLETNELQVGYREQKKNRPVLSNINLRLKKGQLVCLMGQNGAGKSTLLRTLAGVQAPLGGTILLENLSLNNYKLQELATLISIVLTERIVPGNLNVKQVVALGRYPYTNWQFELKKQDQQKIEEAIHLTHIEKLTDRKIHTLSDGQRQKVMIARALAQDSAIMILDEPTAHLDLNNRIEIINLLKKLSRDTNKAILIASHELDLILQTADRLWIINTRGSLQDGIPEDLVLNGMLDQAFEMKGFDLKTGRLTRDLSQAPSIALVGEGYLYLWTKNALEREGYKVSDIGTIAKVNALNTKGKAAWELSNREGTQHYSSLEALLKAIGGKATKP